MARIDAPLLGRLDIRFFHQLIFDTPQLTQFISRTPNLTACDKARVSFHCYTAEVTLSSLEKSYKTFELRISCTQSDWQLSSLAQICSSFLPVISSLEYLYFTHEYRARNLNVQDDIENGQWLELLHPFTAVKSLHVSPKYAPHIAPALQELVGDRAAEVLPALQNVFLEELHTSGPAQEAIGKFDAARQLSGHPITVFYCDGESGMRQDVNDRSAFSISIRFTFWYHFMFPPFLLALIYWVLKTRIGVLPSHCHDQTVFYEHYCVEQRAMYFEHSHHQ